MLLIYLLYRFRNPPFNWNFIPDLSNETDTNFHPIPRVHQNVFDCSLDQVVGLRSA